MCNLIGKEIAFLRQMEIMKNMGDKDTVRKEWGNVDTERKGYVDH